MRLADSITAGGAKGHWAGGWCQKPRVPPDVSPTTGYNARGGDLHCGRVKAAARRRRALLTACLKPYWGKPAVRNFRGGQRKRSGWPDDRLPRCPKGQIHWKSLA